MVTRSRRARLGALSVLASLPLSVVLLVAPSGPAVVRADEPTPAASATSDPDEEPRPSPTRTGGPPKLPTLPAGPSPTPDPEDTDEPEVEETEEAEPTATSTRRRRTPRATSAETREAEPPPASPVGPVASGFDVGGPRDDWNEPSDEPTPVAVSSRGGVGGLEGAVKLLVVGALVLGAAGGAGLWLTREVT